MRCPSALFANPKNVPIVLMTPVKSDTEPIPIAPIVASENMDDDVPDKNPTSVDRTIVGSATHELRIEKYASAFVCSHDNPAHLSASEAINFSNSEL
jgi:hypothetical protein